MNTAGAELRPPNRRSRRTISLAARLGTAYAIVFVALVVSAGFLLLQAFVDTLESVMDEFTERQVASISRIIADLPHPSEEEREIRAGVLRDGGPHTRPRVYMRVHAPDGRMVGESGGMASELPASPAWNQVESGLRESRTGGKFEWRREAVMTEGAPWYIEIAIERRGLEQSRAHYKLLLVALLGGASALAIVLSYALARRGLAPLERLTESASRIGARNLSERLDVEELPPEIARLGETFNATLARLEKAFGRLEGFGADIAHELRTPVQNLRGEAEVALLKPRSPHEYRDVLVGVIEQCDRIARICDDLLLLSRVESNQVALDHTDFDLAAEIVELCAYFDAAAQARSIRLSIEAPHPVHVRADRAGLRRSIANLIDNALAYSGDGGGVGVGVRDLGPEAGIEVVVEDDGPGIASEHLPRVFDRFYRVEKSRSRATGGAGLGLGICRTLVQAHGGSVRLESEVSRGTRAVIRLPAECRGVGGRTPAIGERPAREPGGPPGGDRRVGDVSARALEPAPVAREDKHVRV